MKPIAGWFWKLVVAVRCVRRLGAIQAAKLWLLHGRRGTFRIRVPGYVRPFYLRGASSDPWVFQQLIVSEQYGITLSPIPPKTIVDAGANAAYATRYFKHLWPDAQVVLIEPDADNVNVAAANLDGLSNVTLIHAGLWSEGGRASFVVKNDAKYALRLRMDPAGDVETISVDALLNRMNWDRIDLLKMDIEGAEWEVFGANAASWINRVGILVVELHENVAPGCTKKLFDALKGVDFTMRWRGENLFIFINSLATRSHRHTLPVK